MPPKKLDWNKDIAGNVIAAWKKCAGRRLNDLANDVYENSISGTLSSCLEAYPWPKGFEVTAEYSLMNGEYVRVDKAIMLGSDVEAVRPDIIIHREGDNSKEGNLLCIELKKFRNGEWRHDEDKLFEVTSPVKPPRPFQYQYGLLLRYRDNGEIGIAVLFRGGKFDELDEKTLLL